MKILLPTDGSEHSEAAAHFLLRLNLSSDDAITVIHVISDEPFQDSEDYYSRKIRDIKHLIAPKILDNTMHILNSVPAKIDTGIMTGYPDKCIVNSAKELNVDLIVMGPKRVKGIQSHIVGSTTKSVSINSPKPVLVIKPPQPEVLKTMKILFPTDGSEYARKAGEILALLPFHDTTEITILHVITPAFYDIPEKFKTKMDAGMKEDVRSLMDKAVEDSEEIFEQTIHYLNKRFSHFNSLTKVGEPTDEILQTAYELQPDIIAIGSKGMVGFRGIIGSISRYILSVAECSVLIGKT